MPAAETPARPIAARRRPLQDPGWSMNFGSRHRSRALVVPAEEVSPGSPFERSAQVIRGLASDLVEERRRSKLLEREVRQLKAELAARRSRPAER
jgi:hypothetical protein